MKKQIRFNPAYSSVRTYRWSEEESREMINDGVLELFLETSGTSLWMIGGRTYEVDEGDIVYIGEGIPHRIIEGDRTTEGKSLLASSFYITEGIAHLLRERGPVFRCDKNRERLVYLFERVEAESRGSDLFSKEMSEVIVKGLAIELVRSENEYVNDVTTSTPVTYALSYIREHSGERITLTDVARAAKVSTAYLSRKFKDDIGIGFADYLSRVRLERAAEMLREQVDMSVTEVAFICGFNDSNYFSDKFKREYGLPPLKYRRAK